MDRNSAVYKVLSPEKITPLYMGEKLSIYNNHNHPELDIKGLTAFAEAQALISDCVDKLLPLVNLLKHYPINTNNLMMVVNVLHAYDYILGVTAEIPANKQTAKYVKVVK